LIAGCAVAPRDGSTPKVALVIGNASYENAPSLKNPVNDANDMCAALTTLGYKVLCRINVRDRAEFETHVSEFVSQLGPRSVGVFYYAGHGVQANGANFLIPTSVVPKTAVEDPLRVLYGVEELFDRLREKQTLFKLVILDACRTDLFARTNREPEGRSLVRSLETVAHASNGLAPIRDAPPGTKVFYATASKEAAYDGAGRNGPLTRHILVHIGTPGLKIEDFFNAVTLGVENETRDYRKRQIPFVYGSFSGMFCLAGCRLPPVPGVN
jgi:uncharacterized caspase-like protein